MKLLHCADFHLDSAMTTHVDPETARKRRGEILRNFERMVEFAASEGVEAILIAGDLFDTSVTSELSRNTLLHCITSHPSIAFFYLRGNHDERFRLEMLYSSGKPPVNLMCFGKDWSCYECGDVAVYGAEYSDSPDYDALRPDPSKINILMLHGQMTENPSVVDYGIDVRRLRGKHIDYLALGHLHSHREGILDERGIFCYPGCPEGRGFDECEGEHGLILLETDATSHTLSHTFIPFENRRLFSVKADITGCLTTSRILTVATDALSAAGCQSSSLVKLVLTGELDSDCEKDIGYLLSVLEDKYYFCKIIDETKLKITIEDYLLDESLRGEFVRTVWGDGTLSEDDKAAVVRYGLKALDGEEADGI